MAEAKNKKKDRSDKTSAGSNTAKKRNLRQKRSVRITLAIFLILIVVFLILLLIRLAANAFFYHNEHFTLRDIEVKSPGWWNGRSEKVLTILNLELNKDNLFSIDLAKKRAALEAVPSIGQVSIERILPDSLFIRITEKIPRAVLYERRSKWLVDDSATVMDKDNCIRISSDLPIIYGFQTAAMLDEGVKLQEAVDAIELISLTSQSFPEIKLLTINIQDPKFMDVKLFYGSRREVYSVKIPRNQLKYMMKILKSTLLQAKQTGEKRRVINMTYKGKAIFSGNR